MYLATLAYRPGLVGNEITSAADEGVSKAEKGESGASSGDGDGADVRDGRRSWLKAGLGMSHQLAFDDFCEGMSGRGAVLLQRESSGGLGRGMGSVLGGCGLSRRYISLRRRGGSMG